MQRPFSIISIDWRAMVFPSHALTNKKPFFYFNISNIRLHNGSSDTQLTIPSRSTLIQRNNITFWLNDFIYSRLKTEYAFWYCLLIAVVRPVSVELCFDSSKFDFDVQLKVWQLKLCHLKFWLFQKYLVDTSICRGITPGRTMVKFWQ